MEINTEHLHSTEYRALALAADANYWDIVVVAKRPPSEGTNPAAYVVCKQEGRSIDRAYVVTMGVVNEDGEGFFTGSVYGCSMERAMEILATNVAQDHEILRHNLNLEANAS